MSVQTRDGLGVSTYKSRVNFFQLIQYAAPNFQQITVLSIQENFLAVQRLVMRITAPEIG